MQLHIHDLIRRLQEGVAGIDSEVNVLRRAKAGMSVATDLLNEIKQSLKLNPSFTCAHILELNKSIIPPIYAEYVYFANLHNIETNKPLGIRTHDYFIKELSRIDAFLSEHDEFLRYYRNGNDHLDEIYFKSGSAKPGMYVDLYYPVMDDAILTPYAFKAGMGLAYARLQKELFLLIQGARDVVNHTLKMHWTASKTDLIELIYALFAAGAFNKGNANIKEITGFVESALHLQLGNTSLRFQEICRRKESCQFLKFLVNKLELYIDGIEEVKFRKR
jgi:hypothetical protein